MLTVQLTLDQYEFELHGSTYMWIFFSSKYFSAAWSAIGWIGMQSHGNRGTTNIEATPWWVKAPTPTLLRVNCVSVLCVCMLSGFHCVWLLVIVWTVAHQASLSMGFSRQEYWSGLPFTSPGDLPDPGIERRSPSASALQGDSLPLSHQGSPISCSFSFSHVLQVWNTFNCHSESESDFILLMLKHTWTQKGNTPHVSPVGDIYSVFSKWVIGSCEVLLLDILYWQFILPPSPTSVVGQWWYSGCVGL